MYMQEQFTIKTRSTMLHNSLEDVAKMWAMVWHVLAVNPQVQNWHP